MFLLYVWVFWISVHIGATNSTGITSKNTLLEQQLSFLTQIDFNPLISWSVSNISNPNIQYCCAMSTNGSVSFAGDPHGFIYFSHDYGLTWKESQVSSENSRWSFVSMSASGQCGLAWRWYGIETTVFYRTEDFGRSYQKAFNGTKFYSDDVKNALVSTTGEYFYLAILNNLDVMRLVIIDNYGLGNLTYTTPPCRDSISIYVDRGDRLFCTNTTFIQYSIDHGQTFQRVPNIPEQVWNAQINLNQDMTKGIAFYNTGAALNSGIYLTTDGWNWTRSNFPLNQNLEHILSDYYTGRYVTLIVFGGDIFVSNDFGMNFISSTPSNAESYFWWNIFAMDATGTHSLLTHFTVYDPVNYTTGLFVGTRIIAPAPLKIPSMRPTTTPIVCKVGQYFDNVAHLCIDCAIGHYSSIEGANVCNACQFPLTTLTSGGKECQAASLAVSLPISALLAVILLIIVVGCVALSDQRVKLFVVLILPTLNILSDIAYLLTNDFYHWSIFVFCAALLLYPIPCFTNKIVNFRAAPTLWWQISHIWWLQAERQSDMIYFAKFPLFGRRGRLPLLSMRSHHNLRSIWLELFVWLLAIVAQLLTIVMWLCVTALNIGFLTLWMLLGLLLHLSKVITIGKVWNVWFRVWTGGALFSTDIDVDTEALNECLREEFYFESMPQFVLQLVNGLLLARMSIVAWISIAASLFSILRYGVLMTWRSKKSFRHLPLGSLNPATKLSYQQMSQNSATQNPLLDCVYTEEEESSAPLGEEDHEGLVRKEFSVNVVVDGVQEEDSLLDLESDSLILDANPVVATFVVSYLPSADSNKCIDDVSFNDWLVEQLVALRASPYEAQMCAKLMIEAGVRSQREWKEMSESEFNVEFLDRIGVTLTRLQYHLLSIHSTLRD